MEIWHAIVFGLVEGISEFLPISSTGHLILTARLLGLPQTEFVKSFEIAIQLGAILAVVVLYWRSLFLNREMIGRVAVAFLPTAVICFLLHTIVKQFLFESQNIVLWALLLGGIILVLFERFHQEKQLNSDIGSMISYRQAFLIGIAQSIAIIPGISRSAATIIGGLFLGVHRRAIVDFSFLLAVPTMLAATSLDLIKTGNQFSTQEFGILGIGFVVSFFAALLSIKWLLHFIKVHSFTVFGIYRILIAIVWWIFLT